MAVNADVMIIGAGVTGLSTALHLALRGAGRIVVLERHYAGAGQSGRAAGVVRALVAHSGVSAMLLESIEFFRTFRSRFSLPLETHPSGYLLVANAADESRMDAALAASAAAGCAASRVSPGEAVQLQPGLAVDSDSVCAFEPGAIWTDPMPAVQSLARAAKDKGVVLIEGCEVGDLVVEGGRVMGVETGQGRSQSRRVVVSTAAWGARQLARLGVDVPVYLHRTEMGFFQPAPGDGRRLERIVSDSRNAIYMRPEGSAQMFVGWREGDRIRGTDGIEAADPDDYRQTARYPSLTDLHNRLGRTLPFMRDGFAHRTYACVYDYTPDAMPILGLAPEVEGLHFALGFSGGGFSLSPWVGRVMAACVEAGRVPPEMEMLGPSRFRENRLLDWSNAGAPRQAVQGA